MKVDIKKNTDQLNFEDFLGGVTRIVTIAGVKKGTKEAQYDIAIEGDDRYWRPPPTVLKQLVSAWTDEADTWTGHQALLYGDPDVMMAGQKVGGIRVSHVSHINGPVTESLSVTRGKRKPHTLHPLPDAAPTSKAPPATDPMKRMGALMSARGLTIKEDALAYVESIIGREIASREEMSTDEIAQVIAALELPIGAES